MHTHISHFLIVCSTTDVMLMLTTCRRKADIFEAVGTCIDPNIRIHLVVDAYMLHTGSMECCRYPEEIRVRFLSDRPMIFNKTVLENLQFGVDLQLQGGS